MVVVIEIGNKSTSSYLALNAKKEFILQNTPAYWSAQNNFLTGRFFANLRLFYIGIDSTTAVKTKDSFYIFNVKRKVASTTGKYYDTITRTDNNGVTFLIKRLDATTIDLIDVQGKTDDDLYKDIEECSQVRIRTLSSELHAFSFENVIRQHQYSLDEYLTAINYIAGTITQTCQTYLELVFGIDTITRAFHKSSSNHQILNDISSCLTAYSQCTTVYHQDSTLHAYVLDSCILKLTIPTTDPVPFISVAGENLPIVSVTVTINAPNTLAAELVFSLILVSDLTTDETMELKLKLNVKNDLIQPGYTNVLLSEYLRLEWPDYIKNENSTKLFNVMNFLLGSDVVFRLIFMRWLIFLITTLNIFDCNIDLHQSIVYCTSLLSNKTPYVSQCKLILLKPSTQFTFCNIGFETKTITVYIETSTRMIFRITAVAIGLIPVIISFNTDYSNKLLIQIDTSTSQYIDQIQIKSLISQFNTQLSDQWDTLNVSLLNTLFNTVKIQSARFIVKNVSEQWIFETLVIKTDLKAQQQT
ncbi:unnamed protein product, partial [Didymodactylos carnosus]